MKTLFLTLSLICTTTFAAGFNSIQTEIARTVAQVNSIDEQIKSIKLNESGVLTVVKTNGIAKAFKLSQNNSEILLASAAQLAEVEPQTEIRDMVCEIFVTKGSEQKLSIIDLDNNGLKVMLTSSSCANPTYTFPGDEAALTAAQTLKTQMIVLARQLSLSYTLPVVSNLE